jgi:protein O-GlcNAc transferase
MPLVGPVQALLKEWGLKISESTVSRFLKEIDRLAPLFAPTGSLMLPRWEKLGKDIAREEAEGKVRAGTRPLWKLIKACI